MSISHHRLEPGEKACIHFWGERVVVGCNMVGYVIETLEGWSAFDTSGELIGVFRYRAEALASIQGRRAR